jgi:hypothetical protein
MIRIKIEKFSDVEKRIISNMYEFLFRFIESCTEFNKSFTMQADLGLNILFLIYFFLRVCFVYFSLISTINFH